MTDRAVPGTSGRWPIRLVLVVLLLAARQPVLGAGATVELVLVPERWIGAADAADHSLPEGQVLLFQEGKLSPEMIVPAGSPVTMAPGAWFWIGTAPGYVSAGLEALELPSGAAGESPQRVILPVVEACEVRLAGRGEGSREIQRLDFYSLDRGTVIPRDPGGDVPLRLPAGSFMACGVGIRQLTAITGPVRCRAGATETLPPLSPPSPGHRSFVVHLALPPGTDAALDRVTARVGSASGEPPLPPTAISRAAGQLTLFFLDLPAASPQTLRVEHPEIPDFELPLPPGDGVAADLGLHFLVPPVR